MKRNSYVHCSFDLVESFKPRVPKTRVIGKFVSEEAETHLHILVFQVVHAEWYQQYRFSVSLLLHLQICQ